MRKLILVWLCVITFLPAYGYLYYKKKSLSIEDLNKGEKEFLYLKEISKNCKRSHPILEQVQNTFDLDLGQINLGSIVGIETMLVDFINPNTREWQTIELEDLFADFTMHTGCIHPEITIFLDDNRLSTLYLPKILSIGTLTFALTTSTYTKGALISNIVRYELKHIQ